MARTGSPDVAQCGYLPTRVHPRLRAWLPRTMSYPVVMMGAWVKQRWRKHLRTYQVRSCRASYRGGRVWSRTADSFLAASHALAKSLPLTLSALQSGTISWQHALVMVDETATLDSAGAAALERHFLDPDAPKPATAAPVGDLPAHQASAAWNRLTAAARGLPGPAEARTLTQLRADLCGDWLFGACLQPPAGTGPFRRQWHASSPPMAPAPSTGCWWTRGTGLHWKSAAPATGSPRPCGPLDNEADHILAWGNGGTTGYRTWGSRAQSTTDSGNPSLETHPAHQKRTTRLDFTERPPLQGPSTRTGNHPTGLANQGQSPATRGR